MQGEQKSKEDKQGETEDIKEIKQRDMKVLWVVQDSRNKVYI